MPEKQLTICREPARVIKMAFEGGSILRAVLGAGHAVPQIHLLSLLASRCASTAILQTPRMECPRTISADAINTQAAAGQVEAVTLKGQRFDCGSVKGFLQAIMHVAQLDGSV